MLYESIKKLVQYGIDTGLTPECERVYTTNLLLELFHEDNYEDIECTSDNRDLEEILKDLLDEAVKRGIIEDSITYRDLFDTKIMNCLMPRPSQIQKEFQEKYNISPEEATSYYYKLSQDSDYIRRYRIKKDIRKWTGAKPNTATLDITINLIQTGKRSESDCSCRKLAKSELSYPKCQLCMAKRRLCRTCPTILQDRTTASSRSRSTGHSWGFQYSPYVYYNEHCIVFNGEHVPMKIDRK